MSYLDRIRACNRHDLARYRPFLVGDDRVGWIRRDRREALAARADLFDDRGDAVHLAGTGGFADRSAALAGFVQTLAAARQIGEARGEMFPVAPSFATAPLAQIDRAAVPWFGVRGFGVHLNGYVRRQGELWMWVARRAHDKPNAPGMLDQIVAGGQPIGLGLRANLAKECAEEAGIPPQLAAQARAAGAVVYCAENEVGLKPDTLFCFDLELPEDFVPRNTDGEVAAFELWPIETVAGAVRDGTAFKANCSLVVIDFLVRHGVIAETEPDYLELVTGLRAPLP